MPDHENSARHRIGGNTPEPIDDDLLLNIPRARKRLGNMCKTKTYSEMSKGEFEVVKLGGRTFITRASCDAYIARRITRTIDDKAAIESAKNAARESVRSRQLRAEAKSRQQRAEAKKRKQRLVPGKARGRSERRAAATPID
jgi:hypothetical protein